ncbi:MAG: MiaB/RimO family radical SAM methylthiotransferase [bacterium]|nr:MiaB/RimO family radical SAM methylthiotransferase [bacterium]
MKFYANNFGCRSNQAEIQEWVTDLEKSGYQLTHDLSDAEFGILNTCSLTEKTENDVYKYVNRVYKKNNIKWIIAGCAVTNDKEKLQKRYKNYYFYNNTEKQHLVEEVKGLFPTDGTMIYHSAFRSRIFLKVHDGCNFRCSYCILPFLRGKAVSLPVEELVAKADYFSSLGYREVVLTGINLSSYGYDLFPTENLLNLVQQLDRIKGLDFIRLGSLDPRYIRYDFVKGLSQVEKLADSFHFSFQSASNPVLTNMKRDIKPEEYDHILDQFHQFFPKANYGADFMVGFPGETDKDHRKSLNFIRESRLNYIYTFPFSPRPGTKAALMEQIPAPIIQRRTKELKEANRFMRLNYKERFNGTVLEGILTEEDDHYAMVVTRNFLTVKVPPIRGFKKRKVNVKINRVVNESLCEGVIYEDIEDSMLDVGS